MLSTGAWILIVIIAAILGAVGGFFIARKYMVNYFEENPPISDDMIRSMMMSMGQKPSEKRVRQITQSMKKSNKKI
ncbi:YneF family protein [Aerococcus sp. HMSC10H05]|uniref:YneF family protein n=1 Tax=Aerococcus sp. HMSC10H05 TaxID=1581084 RepID=UPI0008A1FE88|nr:YneF family protein [Aerococcus sp. HMSC10H05]OFU48149.1 hypothetical protein HMPREF3116_08375 [Aerococcus sp. HMSC10H05]